LSAGDGHFSTTRAENYDRASIDRGAVVDHDVVAFAKQHFDEPSDANGQATEQPNDLPQGLVNQWL
jgi:hypothetical protein